MPYAMRRAGGWMGSEATVARPEQIAPQHAMPTLQVLSYGYSL